MQHHGINLTSTRIVSEELAKGNEKGLKKAIRQCLIFSLVIGIVSGAILIFSARYISTNWLHAKVSAEPLYFIAIALPLISMSSAISGYFTAVRRVAKTASGQVLEHVVKFIVTMYLLNIYLPRGLEYACIALIIGDFISELCSFIYIYILYKLDKRRYTKIAGESSYVKPILRITIPVAITSYVRSGLSTLKQMLIPLSLEKGGMSCEESLSEYGLINGMAMPILMFPSVLINAFSSLLVPEVATFYTKKDYDKINRMISIIFKVVTIFSVCVIGIFLCFSEELSTLIYNSNQVAKYMVMLAPILILMYLDNIIDSILKGIDKQVGVMLCNILDLVVTILFILIFLPVKGVMGYIIVIYISEILNFGISFIQLKKATNFKIEIMSWIIKPSIICFMSIAISNSLNISSEDLLKEVLIKSGIICLVYLFLNIFSIKETFNNVISKI